MAQLHRVLVAPSTNHSPSPLLPLDHLFGAVARAKLARRVALALNYFAPSAAPATPPGKPLPPCIALDVVYASLCCWLKSNGVISDPSWGLRGRGTRNEIEKNRNKMKIKQIEIA